MQYESHPALAAFPLMTGEAFKAFTTDIKRNGQLEDIWLWRAGVRKLILDGRNRLRACAELGVTPRFRLLEHGDPISFVISMNLQRRMLNESQRAIVAAKLDLLPRGRPSKLRRQTALSSREAAHVLNVGESSVERARRVLTKGVPELVERVEIGEMSVTAAAELAKRSQRDQRAELEQAFAKASNMRPMPREANRTASCMSQAVRLPESDLVALEVLAELGDRSREPRARAGAAVLRRIVPALPERGDA